MKLSKELPPNIEDIKKVLPITDKTIYCFGDTIYNAENLRPDLIAHEQVHSDRQGRFPEVWWYKYLNDVSFRLEEELEAYGAQYKLIKKYLKGKTLRYGLEEMAHALSSPMYGNIITFNEAVSKIRNKCK